VADVSPVSLGVVIACAAVEALDALVVPGRATACRVADDETLFVCAPDVVGEITREVETRLTVVDTDAVVLDATDGWAALRIDGDDAAAVLAEVSRLRIPQPGFAQGDVAHVAAKVLVDDGGIVILAPASTAHHVRTRIDQAVAGDR
jgi:glycine cleavage system aminomethyltransferase T